MSDSRSENQTRSKGGRGKGGKPSKKDEPVPASPAETMSKILLLTAELKLEDRITAAKALAGMAGMVALFPSQIPAKQKKQAEPVKDGDKKKKKEGPKDPPNPLKKSDTYRKFQDAQKALKEAKNQSGDEDLPDDNPLVIAFKKALEDWKSFREQHARETDKSQAAPIGGSGEIAPYN